ncbi:hypothetical protein AB0911_36685 [Streptomyces nigra]|uniref:hypothetical protein n=1 Tax=Streptomyces nigra TaxID=1827580 RepID=UPI00345234F0
MRAVHQVAKAVDANLPGNRTVRIQRDAPRVNELAESGFDGLAYKVFEDDLCREAWPPAGACSVRAGFPGSR